MTGFPSIFARSSSTLLALLFGLLLVGCSVVFVAPYDAVIDESLTNLYAQTLTFLDRMERTGDSYSSQRAFYDEAKGAVSAIKTRAALLPKNSGTTKNLDELSGQYDRLAELHRQGPLVGLKAKIARELIDSNFRSVMQLELHKKLGAAVVSPAQTQH
jgi:hypothetical protein